MEPNPTPNRRRDILLVVYSLISILVLLGRGIYLVIASLIPFEPQSTTLSSNIYGAVSMFFCVVLLLPGLILTIRRLRGQALQSADVPPAKVWQVAVLVGIWGLVIILSSVLLGLFNYGWAVALPFFLLGIAIPVACLVWIAIGGLSTGSWRRLWSVLAIGMTASTSIAIILELLFVGLALLVAGIIAAINPAILSTLQQLKNQITNAGGDIQALLPILAPYLNNPLVFLAILLFISGIGPLIEEAAKPIAVWLVGKRMRSPAEGFALGALCGAGFALLEGMLVTSGATDMLGFSLAGRATSSLMHITASALMGWAIASALLEKRYGRLALTYLLSVGIHGLWNGSVLLTVYGGLRVSVQQTATDFIGGASIVIGVGILGLMFVTILVILPIINRRLRRDASRPNVTFDVSLPQDQMLP